MKQFKKNYKYYKKKNRPTTFLINTLKKKLITNYKLNSFDPELHHTILNIKRVSKTFKGGRKATMGITYLSSNRKNIVTLINRKSNFIPIAIESAKKKSLGILNSLRINNLVSFNKNVLKECFSEGRIEKFKKTLLFIKLNTKHKSYFYNTTDKTFNTIFNNLGLNGFVTKKYNSKNKAKTISLLLNSLQNTNSSIYDFKKRGFSF